MRNILIMGDPLPILNILSSDRHFLITSQIEAQSLGDHVSALFSEIYAIDTPETFEATCFEQRMPEIVSIAQALVGNHGSIDGIVSTHEHTVLPSALLREEFGVSGIQPTTALLCRDKIMMRKAMNITTTKVPFLDTDVVSYLEFKQFLAEHRRIIIKPSRQAASFGIEVISDQQGYNRDLPTQSIVEPFIDLPIIHLDGYVVSGELRFMTASQSVNTCFSYTNLGGVLGSVIITDKEIYHLCLDLALITVKNLGINDSVFHIECFKSDEGLIFLEAAARYGGGGINQLVKYTTGVSLSEAAYIIESGDSRRDNLPQLTTPPQRSVAMINFALPEDAQTFFGWKIKEMGTLPQILQVVAPEPGTLLKRDEIERFSAALRIYIVADEDGQALDHVREMEKTVEVIYESQF